MAAQLPDPYNPPGKWQGAMRSGPFDFVATRYALAANDAFGGVDWLAVSHLDCLAGFAQGWPFCRRYTHEGAPQASLATYDGGGRIVDLRLARPPDLARQARLTALLGRCAPVAEQAPPGEMIDLLEQETGRPVGLCAWGSAAADRVATCYVDGARRARSRGAPARQRLK